MRFLSPMFCSPNSDESDRGANPNKNKVKPMQEQELGILHAYRSLSDGFIAARKSGKPIFLLFQEIPGCSTCTTFGKDVLKNKLLVEFIETEFVPIAINNRGKTADEREALARFREPYLNNPVVRFVNSEGFDLIPRETGIYSPLQIFLRAKAALLSTKNSHGNPFRLPLWIDLLEHDLRSKAGQSNVAVFSMGCYWRGEVVIGAVPGVVSTIPGWIGDREVVVTHFIPELITFGKLIESVHKVDNSFSICPQDDQQKQESRRYEMSVMIGRDAGKLRRVSDSETKYYLKKVEPRVAKTNILLEAQLCRWNSLVHENSERVTRELLSPIQRKELAC